MNTNVFTAKIAESAKILRIEASPSRQRRANKRITRTSNVEHPTFNVEGFSSSSLQYWKLDVGRWKFEFPSPFPLFLRGNSTKLRTKIETKALEQATATHPPSVPIRAIRGKKIFSPLSVYSVYSVVKKLILRALRVLRGKNATLPLPIPFCAFCGKRNAPTPPQLFLCVLCDLCGKTLPSKSASICGSTYL